MMPDLVNCPSCGSVMVRNKFRDICDGCYKEEEKMFDTVYKFMRRRENRAATIPQVIEGTGVSEDLLFKFIRAGRIQLANFPNFGYPCDKCGKIIRTGKICEDCSSGLRKELEIYQKEEERKEEIRKRENQRTYFANKN